MTVVKSNRLLLLSAFGILAIALCVGFVFADESSADGNACRIGDTEYATIGEAINAVEDGQTITVLQNLTVTESITINEKSFTVDFNSKKVTGDKLGSRNIIQIGGFGEGPTYTGDLVIKNAEFLGSTGNTCVNVFQIELSGNVTIENCKFNCFDGLNREIRAVGKLDTSVLTVTNCKFDRSMGSEGDILKISGTGPVLAFNGNIITAPESGEQPCLFYFDAGETGFKVAVPAVNVNGTYYADFEQAMKDVQKGKSEEPGPDVVVGFAADDVKVEVSSDKIKAAADLGADVVVSTSEVSVGISSDTLKGMGLEGSFQLNAKKVTEIPDEYKGIVGDNGLVLDLSMNVNGSAVTQFSNKIAVTCSYKLPAGCLEKDLKVICLSGDQSEKFDVVYDKYTQTVTFSTGHFSEYAIIAEKSSSDNGSNNVGFYAVIGVVVVITLLLMLMAVRKH